MPHNENSRVKIPALVHFTRLGYKYISLRKYEGVIDDDINAFPDDSAYMKYFSDKI